MAAPVVPYEFTDSKSGGSFAASPVTQTGAGTTSNLAIPLGMSVVRAAAVLVAAGTAYLEVTFSPRENVLADTAVWMKWTPGNVTASTYSDITGATGVRLVVSSGTWQLACAGD